MRAKYLLQQETAQLVGDQSARLRLESSDHSQIDKWCCKPGLSTHKTWTVAKGVVLWLTNNGQQSLLDWAEVILGLLTELSPMPWQLALHDSTSAFYRTAGTSLWSPIWRAFQHSNAAPRQHVCLLQLAIEAPIHVFAPCRRSCLDMVEQLGAQTAVWQPMACDCGDHWGQQTRYSASKLLFNQQ